MAGVTIGPRDIHAFAGLHMNLYAYWLSSGIEWNGHELLRI
jgi:hypothetical protein